MLNSKALTKIQSLILIAVIVVAALGGVAAYVLLSGHDQPSGTIKIGYIGNLENEERTKKLRGAEWAVEQINAEGGVLGRLLELIVEDSGGDLEQFNMALTRLITVHEVDFIVGALPAEKARVCQDACAIHRKIYLAPDVLDLDLTQRVADDYDKYKYFFRCNINQTVGRLSNIDSILTLREYSGFNKIAILSDYYQANVDGLADLEAILPETYGFDVVYSNSITEGTIDFTSYFAQIEAAGAEILVTIFVAPEGIGLIKEWYDRQSPTIMCGLNLPVSFKEGWDYTGGKCEYVTTSGMSFNLGNPVTNKTLPTREAYIERWGEDPTGMVIYTYEAIRFILYDALKRAGTTKTDEVIKALEETSIETCMHSLFTFTSSHDCMVREGESRGTHFQWQNGILVPVHPKEMMERAGATYTFPDWPGPWD